MTRRGMACALVVAMLSAVAAAQAYAPIVTMVVTMPDGRTQELTAVESGMATPTAVLGEIEVRRGGPAMDSKTNPSFKMSVPKVSAN